MAGGGAVREDASMLSRLDRSLLKLETIFALISGLAVFSLMIFAVVSVGGRSTINQPLPGYVDWIEQVLPLIAFMGVSYTQRFGGHIRMDIVIGLLKGRALWAAEIITVLAMLFLMILLVWGSWAHFVRAFDFAAPLWSRDSSIDIGIPLWPAKLLAPVAFSVLCLRLILQLWSYVSAFVSNNPSPVAVPLLQSAAQQAEEEAAHVSSLNSNSTDTPDGAE